MQLSTMIILYIAVVLQYETSSVKVGVNQWIDAVVICFNFFSDKIDFAYQMCLNEASNKSLFLHKVKQSAN